MPFLNISKFLFLLNPVEGRSDYLLLSFFAAKTFIPFTLKKLQVFCLYCFLRNLMSFTQITKHFIAYYVLTYEYMPFRMGRPKTTGCSHNKEASTYTRKQPLSKTKSKQLTLPAFLNKRKQQNNEEATTSTIVREILNVNSQKLTTSLLRKPHLTYV